MAFVQDKSHRAPEVSPYCSVIGTRMLTNLNPIVIIHFAQRMHNDLGFMGCAWLCKINNDMALCDHNNAPSCGQLTTRYLAF